jgi:hypothetical protein
MDTDEVLSCADQPGYASIEAGLELLSTAERIYAHNGIGFDIPALAKVYPQWKYSGQLFDTLIASRHRWAHIKETDFALQRRGKMPGNLIGKHSLEAWGCRMGILKGDYGKAADWKHWSPEMQEYCERDTLVLRELILRLRSAGFNKESMDNEMALAWELEAQQRNGVPFDMDKAIELQGVLAAKKHIVGEKLIEHFGSWLARDGKKTVVPKRDNKKRGIYAGAEYSKLKVVDFNPGSRDHIALRLQRDYGWKPDVFTESGKPKVDEGTVKGLDYPIIPDLIEYLLVDKRLSQMAEAEGSWFNSVKKNPQTGLLHIHGTIIGTGTVTHRASHMYPNLSGVPKVGKPYGKECRELFHAPPGWQLLGADMSGLELRCLAHYMARWDDMAYGRVLLEGDVHTANQHALELPDEPADGRTTKGRDATKTYFYAYLYGAGDTKLGKILYPTLSESKQKALGKASRKKFEGGLPALGYLVDALKKKAAEQGYINLIDGRRAYVRHPHAVLNTLLQGTGAVLCKYWVVDTRTQFRSMFGPQGWDKQWAALLWPHDEQQIAVRPQIADAAARHIVVAAEAQTARFSFRCPLTGEAKLGTTWASTH